MEVKMIDFSLIVESLPALLHGALFTLGIALIAASIGLSLGTILGLCSTLRWRALSVFITLYVTILRGTPMLVQILFLYYVLPQFGLSIPPFWAASIAIGLNSAAYMSQVMLSGINTVGIGQIEAAKTLGLNPFQTMRYIIFPQAFRAVLPSIGNELITLVKDSSLASIIGVVELAKAASIIRSRTYDAFSILLAISAIYLLLTSTIGWLIKAYERKCKEEALCLK